MIDQLAVERVQSGIGKVGIWQEPLEGGVYVIGADVAEGKMRDRQMFRNLAAVKTVSRPDYSAACVVEVESAQHVASWHGYMDPSEYAVSLAALGLYYNTALLIVEVNGPGIAVVERLDKDLRYPNLYQSKVWGRVTDDPLSTQMGWRTTQESRQLLIARCHEMLNSDRLFTRDQSLINELRTMEFDEAGVPRARGKNKDDRVFALGLALQARYEMLYGTLTTPEEQRPESRLKPEDRAMWDIVRREISDGSVVDRHRPRFAFRSGRILRPGGRFGPSPGSSGDPSGLGF